MPKPARRVKSKPDINAAPTKKLFIDMLIRDVALADAIIDLVDNSVDGARRVMGRRRKYNGYWVHLKIAQDHFVIEDNCGGIGETLARNYAFRFGRPSTLEGVDHSVGQFGVGMKRALFKLGRAFRVESVDRDWRFAVSVDVDEWEADEDRWEFDLDVEQEAKPTWLAAGEYGTRIEVHQLRPEVARAFSVRNVRSRIRDRIADAHLPALLRGLEVTVNGTQLEASEPELKCSRQLRPVLWEQTLPTDEGTVDVHIWVGLTERQTSQNGWYVFCNDRLILGPDQEITTGWGESAPRIPKYHGQFGWFRGYVFMQARKAAALPWNTPKTGVDEDAPLWRRVRSQMILMMKPWTDLLNQVKEEHDRARAGGEKPLRRIIDEAPLSPLRKPKCLKVFARPSVPSGDGARPNRITYYKPPEEIRRVRESLESKGLDAETLGDVGARTFEEYLKHEVMDDAGP